MSERRYATKEELTADSPDHVPLPPGSAHALTVFRGADGRICTMVTPALFRGATPEFMELIMSVVRDTLMETVKQ